MVYETCRSTMLAAMLTDMDEYLRLSDEFDAHAEDVARHIASVVDLHGCARVDVPSSPLWWYVHHGTDGVLRVTTWDRLGPVSHERVDCAALARFVRENAGDLVSVGTEDANPFP